MVYSERPCIKNTAEREREKGGGRERKRERTLPSLTKIPTEDNTFTAVINMGSEYPWRYSRLLYRGTTQAAFYNSFRFDPWDNPDFFVMLLTCINKFLLLREQPVTF